MSKNPKSGEDRSSLVETKLKLVQQIAEMKRQATGSGSQKRTLRDEDFTVVTVSLRVPSSRLLGSRPDGSPSASGGPDVIMIDADPSDIGSADHDGPSIVLPR